MTQTSARWIVCQHCNGLETIKDACGQYRDFDISEGNGGWFEPKPMSANAAPMRSMQQVPYDAGT
jgi:hypothetical protein